MSATLAFVDRLKRHVIGEHLVRRNPFYYDRAVRLLERLEGEGLEQRRAWTQDALQRTFALARRTDYGCIVRGGDTLASWPLLEKEMLRGEVRELKDRIAVLERIVTDGDRNRGLALEREIEALRDKEVRQ